MTTTLLRKALLDYLDRTVVTEEERNSIDAAIVELDEIEQRAGANDAWNHECYIMYAETVVDLLDIATYDTYSKLYATQHGTVSYVDYEQAVIKFLPELTTAAVELGYDIVHDLYADNEQRYNTLTAADTDCDKRMIKESREVMSMLEYCMNEPDADISISVKHKNGKHTTANLYDHAALVQELYSALKYFIEEMQ